MSHVQSAASIKDRKIAQKFQDFPKENTKIRALYDFLASNKGHWVEFRGKDLGFKNLGTLSNARNYLVNFYGFDIRTAGSGYGAGKSKWLLAGEWQGRIYLDFVQNPDL